MSLGQRCVDRLERLSGFYCLGVVNQFNGLARFALRVIVCDGEIVAYENLGFEFDSLSHKLLQELLIIVT